MKNPMKKIPLLLLLSAAWHGASAVTIVDPGQGSFTFDSGSTAAAELSGLTYAGGTSYYAVGDNGATSIWTASIAVNTATGYVTSGSVTGSISTPQLGTDSEGIAFRSTTNSVFVSDEVASTIKEFSIATGVQLSSVTVPTVYNNVVNNMGLEGLSLGAGKLWTANEEALSNDGPQSTTSTGSWVRLQRFDGTMSLDGQWAYRTDPISANSPHVSGERSGVSDVLALPTGGLLVLERELGGDPVPDFRLRLYEVNFTGASDVVGVGDLSLGGFTAVGKTLLWERTFAATNFEGLTLGPMLDNGRQSILLVSDNGSGTGGQTQSLYALSANVPEPSSALLLVLGAALVFFRRKPTAPRGV